MSHQFPTTICSDINGQSKKYEMSVDNILSRAHTYRTGNTALHEAILGGPGNLECIKMLLK